MQFEGTIDATYDDFRTLLAPFKTGWHWNNGRISYCRGWEEEDKNLTPIERTRRVMMGTMGNIEEYLGFTSEMRLKRISQMAGCPRWIQRREGSGGLLGTT